MNIEELRAYCLSLKGATEDMPFENKYLMFRIFGKWFAVVPLDDQEELKVFVKCDPAKAIELREHYDSVTAAWHFNKKHWNCIVLNRDMNDKQVRQWIQHSLEEVVKKMPKKIQNTYWQ